MKITAIEAIPYTIPYRHPLVFATGTLRGAEHMLLRVHTDEGLTGLGEAVSRPMIYGESQASITAAVRDWLAPGLIGLDPFAVERAQPVLRSVVANNTARGALDIALHDLRGKALDRTCRELLGGAAERMRVAAMLTIGEPAAVAEEALAKREELGITAFKIKVGLDERKDVATVAAVREAVGEDAFLYVDANHGYRAEQALRALSGMRDARLELAEEPCPAEDRLGRQAVAGRLDIPVMSDESTPDLGSAGRELGSGAARAISIKTARTGFTESAKIVGLAQGLGARTVMGSQGDSMVGSCASLNFGAAYAGTSAEPGELDYFTLLTDDILADPLVISGGMLPAPTGPGIGAVIDEGKLAHYRVDRDR
jgi:L-alanine-DL-glutamate epimerase-like enolase superfamily enzyme